MSSSAQQENSKTVNVNSINFPDEEFINVNQVQNRINDIQQKIQESQETENKAGENYNIGYIGSKNYLSIQNEERIRRVALYRELNQLKSLRNYYQRAPIQQGGKTKKLKKQSWRDLEYYDEHGVKIKHLITERKEQILADKYIKPDDVVLELGARYGTVSCVINKKLKNKHNQVVVEPDNRVWQPLEDNMKRNNCDFHIIKGFISNKKMKLTDKDFWRGYGTSSEEDPSSKIPSYTLDEIQKKYKLNFNVLVADCEGFLCQFLEENPGFLDQLRLIIFEKDNPKICNYNGIKKQLEEKKFKQLVPLFREAWRRPPSLVRKTRKVKKNT